MAWKQFLKASALANAILFATASSAFADPPPNSPIVSAPGGDEAAGGPTVWNANQEISALDGPRTQDPEFLAKGIPLGALRLFPDFMSGVSYDDNVFRVATGTKSDFFFTETPTLVLDYDTQRTHVDLYGDGAFNLYNKLATVDNNEYNAGVKGTYLISRAAQFSGNVSVSQLSEPLSSPDTVGFQAKPNTYYLIDASGQVKIQPNRLGVVVGGSDDSYRYFDTPLLGGGNLYNGDRDNSVYKGFVEIDYDFSPGYAAFARGTYNSDQFDRYFDRSGIHRSSSGYEADAGLKLLLGNLMQGSLYAGYVDQTYDHNQPIPLSDISGLDFGANIFWYPTELLTLQLSASRQIENTTLAGASGGDDRNVNLTAAYEVTRRVLLTLNAGYDDTAFKGSIPYQDDRTPTAGASLKYLVSHYAQLTATYQYSTRNSTLAGLHYDDHLMSVSLNLQV